MHLSKYNESYIKVEGADLDLAISIRDYFSFYADNYFWSPKFRAGVWDGKIKLFNIASRLLPIGFLDKLIEFLMEANEDFTIDDSLEPIDFSYVTDAYLTALVKKLKCEQEIRDYQFEVIKKLLNENKAIHLLPTSSGKSFCYYLIMQCILEMFPDWKILLVVPRVSLVEQMNYDLKDYDRHAHTIDNDIHMIYAGKEKTVENKITISTWQSLQEVEDKSIFKEFDAVIVDEVHGAASEDSNIKVLADIIQNKCTNSKICIGMSGSIKDSTVNQMSLVSLFGPIFESVTTRDLIDAGYISDLKIWVMLLKYSEEERREMYKASFQSEMAFVANNKKRFKFIVQLFRKINNGNSLIIFRNIKYGEALYKALQHVYPDRKIFYVAGKTPVDDREEIRRITNDFKDAIIVASAPVFAEGINITSLEYLILAQSFKSKIKIIQSIGRTLRKHEGKEVAKIIDIVDDLTWKRSKNYIVKHGLERIKIYKKQGFKFSIKEIELKE